MRSPLRVLLVVLLWLTASGAHLDLLQAVAWARMWTQNLERMTIVEATEETFDPGQMCGLCHLVAGAKESTQEQPTLPPEAFAKALLYFERQRLGAYPPRHSQCARTALPPTRLPSWKATPPTPPPRAESV